MSFSSFTNFLKYIIDMAYYLMFGLMKKQALNYRQLNSKKKTLLSHGQPRRLKSLQACIIPAKIYFRYEENA